MQRLVRTWIASVVAIVAALGSSATMAGVPQSAGRADSQPAAEVPFEIYRRWTIVPVQVAGSPPLRFIFDTGAPVTVLADAVLARTLPLEIVGQARLGGAGDGEMPTVLLAGNVPVQLGDIPIGELDLVVGIGSDVLAGADGIIGTALLDRFVVEIDWQSQRLLLFDPDAWLPAAGAAVLPLRTLASGHLVTSVYVSIDGSRELATEVAVDTGAGHPLSLEPTDASSLPRRRLEQVILGWGANGVLRGDIGRVSSLRLGTTTLHDVVATFPDGAPWSRLDDSPRGRGNLGAQVLQRFRVAFDTRGGRLALRAVPGFDAPFSFDQAGMALRPFVPGAEAIEVADVVAGSPAAEAGVRADDRLTRIQGRPVAALLPDEVLELFEGAREPRVHITWLRGGESFAAELQLRPLI